LLDDLKKNERILEIKRGSVRSLSMENSLGIGYGTVVRQTTE